VELFQEAEFWVGVAFLIFIGLMVWMKVPGIAVKVLDARADKIRAELAEAERLRKEAEALLASIRARREAAEKQAAELLANAEVEARQLEAEAHARLEEQIRRRGEIAKAKIAQAETQAAAEVKSAAAELAIEAAASLLAKRAQGLKSDPLVDQAMGDLSAKLQ
jgi:F-type H+-transporting ATPase subunit b